MTLKLASLKLSNLHKFSEISVDFDKNLTFLSGGNGSGKTSVGLTGLQIALEGIAQKGQNALHGERFRFIGEVNSNAKVAIVLHDVERDFDITITRKITKSETTVKIESSRADITLDATWLSTLFQSMMFSPDTFVALPGIEQAKRLGVDTSAYDAKIKALKEEYTMLNRIYKEHGILEEVEAPEGSGNIPLLLLRRDEITAHNTKHLAVVTKLKDSEINTLKYEEQISALQESVRLEKGCELGVDEGCTVGWLNGVMVGIALG